MHILSHYGGATEDKLQHQMAKWIPNHMIWVKSISRRILHQKSLDVKDYLKCIIMKGTPFDEICLLIFCHMYEVHLAVIFNMDFWTTRRDNDINSCDTVLAYRGHLTFDNTVKLDVVNPPDEIIVSQKNFHVHCDSQTVFDCSPLCNYGKDDITASEPGSPNSQGYSSDEMFPSPPSIS